MKNGESKTIMTFAKLARGYMARYIINTNANATDVSKFSAEGYRRFGRTMSTDTEMVFIR
ncbi:MAG: peroxide stress protein YaaA [Gelidibacter sp.]